MADDFGIERFLRSSSLRAEVGHEALAPSQTGDPTQRLRETREALLAAHAELLARDEEFHAITAELIDLKEAAEAALARRVAEIESERDHLNGLRAALEAWHARSEAEFEASKRNLVAERDEARQRANLAESQARVLGSRIEHTLMVHPRRFAGRIQRWLRRGRVVSHP